MAPYYEDDLVTLYHGDCLELTEWLAADVLVTDPPYGMGFQSNQRKGAKLAPVAGDEDTRVRDGALELWGTVRPSLVFGRWSVAAPAGERQRLIWAKGDNPGMGDLSIPWGPAHEDIHLLGSGWDVKATGQKRTGSVIVTRGARGGASGDENSTGHPTPKPVPLMEALLMRTPPRCHRRSIRGFRGHLDRCPQPRTPRYRCRVRGTLLRDHRVASLAAGIQLRRSPSCRAVVPHGARLRRGAFVRLVGRRAAVRLRRGEVT